MELPDMARALRRTLVLTVVLLPWFGAHGANLYRYENDDGKIVYGQHVPPEFVHQGYTVLSEEGRVVRVVPRELTPAERKVRDAELALIEAEEQRLEERLDDDKELLRLYKSPDDVARARDRKLRALRGAIDVTLGNVDRLLKQKMSVEAHAAELERGGLPVSEAVMDNLRIIDEQIAEQRAEIDSRERQQNEVRARYDTNMARVKELLRRSGRYPSR